MNDDVIFTKKNWDQYLDLLDFKMEKKKPYVFFTRGHQGFFKRYYFLATEFPIINKYWFKKLGYIGNKYTYGFIDYWICELARRSKNYLITKEIFFHHIKDLTKKLDKTSENLYINQSEDWNIWEKTQHIRLKHSKKINCTN